MLIAMILKLFAGSAKKPLLIALITGVVLMLLTAGYFSIKSQAYQAGYRTAEHQFLQEKERAVIEAIKGANRRNQSNNEIARAYWQQQMDKKPKIQALEKRIIEYVEVTNNDECLLNDDELFILGDLVDIANGATTSQSKD